MLAFSSWTREILVPNVLPFFNSYNEEVAAILERQHYLTPAKFLVTRKPEVSRSASSPIVIFSSSYDQKTSRASGDFRIDTGQNLVDLAAVLPDIVSMSP